jgi:CheY-like chemotaxis protein
MTAPAPQRRRVLFVDDDPQFLQTVTELMTALSGGAWEILTADGAGGAFSLLMDHPMDLAVIDIQMSVVDGIQLLALLNRGHPNVKKVALTGHATEKHRADCLASGADLFLEKPTTVEGWKHVHSALNELLRFQAQSGFRGVLRQVGLQDVVQMECLARDSAVLEVSDANIRGEIFLEVGQVVHAQLGAFQGTEAFNRLLSLAAGQFNLKPYTEPPARTITGPWEFLLMEAARKRDEADAVPAPPRAEPPLGLIPMPAQAKVETLLAMTEAAEQPVPVNAAPATARPEILEMLVCSNQGEVLCETGCRDAAWWVGFFEFLSQRAQRLTQGLPLGDFDRLEIETAQSRSMVIIAADRGVLVKVVNEHPSPAPGNPLSGTLPNPALAGWMRQSPPLPGEILRGIRFADRTFVCDHDSTEYPLPATEVAWRCLADTYDVLAANQIKPDHLVWHYQHAALHCVRHPGEAIFGVLALPDMAVAAGDTCRALLEEFRTFKTA